jgi:adiponectin receptor
MNKRISVGNVVDKISAFIGGMTEAPDHLVDNEFIHRGYRIGYHYSIRSILRSLFQFHNESVNVWSHLLGMIFFGSVMILYTLNSTTSWKDISSLVWTGLD